MDDVLTLIGATAKTQDENGVWHSTPTERLVYCQRHDITRAEFFGAGRNGMSPDFMLTVNTANYNGERVCRFHDQQYNIYRTYRRENGDYIELYCEKTAGAN